MSKADSTSAWIQARLDKITAGHDRTLIRNEILDRASSRIRDLVRSALKTRPDLVRWEQDEDVLQEALRRIDHALQDAKPVHSGQFYKIASQHVQWTVRDLVRHHFGPEGQGRHHHSGTAMGAGDGTHPGFKDPAVAASEQFDLVKLHKSVDDLDPDEQDALRLCFYLGMTHKEAAEQLGVGTKTIQRRLKRAKVRLAILLGESEAG